MSPEQVRGEQVDQRTDFFSFGARAVRDVTGTRAFPGPVAVSGQAILQGSPAELPPGVPDGVRQVVERCLEKDPARRFHSANDLAFHLESLRSSLTHRPRPGQRAPRDRRWLPLLGAIAVAMAVAAALVRFGRPVGKEIGAPRVQRLTFTHGQVFTARFGPNGRQVLFSGSWEGEPARVYSTTLERPDFRPLPLESAELLAVSPKGDLALRSIPRGTSSTTAGRGTLAIVPLVGGAPRELLDGVSYADWSPRWREPGGRSPGRLRAACSSFPSVRFSIGPAAGSAIRGSHLGETRWRSSIIRRSTTTPGT